MQSLTDLGLLELRAQKHLEAYNYFQQAIHADCADQTAWWEISQALLATGKLELALTCLCKTDVGSWQRALLIGQTLKNLGRFRESLDYLRQAISLEPSESMCWYSLSYSLTMLGFLDEALRAATAAQKLAPGRLDSVYLQAHINLAGGNWKEGWNLYEIRLLGGGDKKPDMQSEEPLWAGESLEGKVLHVYAEQGFGDTIQFSRFIFLLPPTCKVVFLAPQELARYFRANLPEEILIHNAGTLSPIPCDYGVYVGSLPSKLGLSESPEFRALQSPDDVPLIEHPVNLKLAVGVVWRGDPRHPNDKFRSSSLEDFAFELALPGVELYSLQISRETVDATLLGPIGIVQDLAPKIRDFADTAGLIEQLDCVVCVDTSVGHLAGSLGIPTHILIPYGAVDWRWQHNRTDSPWYPSVTLWRQQEGESWRMVLRRVANHLRKQIAGELQ